MKKTFWSIILALASIPVLAQASAEKNAVSVEKNGGLPVPSGYLTIQQGGTNKPQESILNFINGTNMTITCADDGANGRTSCTFTAAGGGSGVATDSIWTAAGQLVVGTGTATAHVIGSGTGLLHQSGAADPTWSTVATGDIAAAAVTYAKIQNESNATLLGNDSGGAAAPSEITLVAPLNFPSSTSLGVSITTTNDGGAVVKQAASPGTQQGSSGSANFNLNGIGILETDSLGPATAKGLVLQNTTASTGVTTTQWSPAVDWQGTGWNSSGSASQVAEWRAYVAPQTVAGTITSRWFLDRQDNGGGFTTELQVADNGTLTVTGALTTSGAVTNNTNNSQFSLSGTNNNGSGGFNQAISNGASTVLTVVRALSASCTSGTTCDTSTNIPANFTVLAVQYRITTAITGATTVEFGTALNATSFCTGLTTLTVNTTGVCHGGPTNAAGVENSSAAALRITATAGTFTAGVVEFMIIGLANTVPTS